MFLGLRGPSESRKNLKIDYHSFRFRGFNFRSRHSAVLADHLHLGRRFCFGFDHHDPAIPALSQKAFAVAEIAQQRLNRRRRQENQAKGKSKFVD